MGESLKIQPESNEPRKPEARKSAEVVYLKNFATYSDIPGGHLLQEEYERTKKAAEETGAEAKRTLAINANTYAGKAGITLSDDSLVLYSILCKDEDISSDLLHGDQQRLAEVLRMEGRAADAEKLIAAYKKVNPGMKF